MEDQVTQKLHVLDREFKRPGVYKRPPSAAHDIVRYVSMCLILLCLLFALGMATFLVPDYHFSVRGIIDPPTPTQIPCVHVKMLSADNIHWTSVRDYHC